LEDGKMKRRLVFVAVIVLLGIGYAMAGTWATLDKPDAHETYINGIDGDNIVGYYKFSPSGYRGFLYNGTTWTDLEIPGVGLAQAEDIDGSNIVGQCSNIGFLYNGTSWTTIGAVIHGIDGGNLVGWSVNHGFLYNLTNGTSTILDKPGAGGTYITAIDGSNLVGYWETPQGGTRVGFLYNGTSWTNISVPTAYSTYVTGIDGANLVGYYNDWDFNADRMRRRGFLYNGVNYTILDMPGAYNTYINGIDGINLVGKYTDNSGVDHGFVYTIPEPASLLLLGLGGLLIRYRK
jgi:hypothetical protein